jgi:hypothetical protein
MFTAVFLILSIAEYTSAQTVRCTTWNLEHLCQQVERAERNRAKSLGLTDETAKSFGCVDFGSHPDDWLICNCFVWYANALSNFIGVFMKAFLPAENLKQEFANVIKWRNKVAAHTSWVDPKHDNAGTQNMSILLFPEFGLQGDGHFWVGGFRVFSADTNDKSCPDWHWGLVPTHDRLKEIVDAATK